MFDFQFLSPDICDCHVPIRTGLTSPCLLQRLEGLFWISGHCRDCMRALRKVIRIDSITRVLLQIPWCGYMASITKPWLMCGYFSVTIFFVVKPCLIFIKA